MTGLRDLTRSRDGYRWVRLNIFRTHFGVDQSYDSVMSSPGWDIRRRRRPRPMYTDDEMYTWYVLAGLGVIYVITNVLGIDTSVDLREL